MSAAIEKVTAAMVSGGARWARSFAATAYTAYMRPAPSSSATPTRKPGGGFVSPWGPSVSIAVPVIPTSRAVHVRVSIRSSRNRAASTVIRSGALQIAISEPTETDVIATPQK